MKEGQCVVGVDVTRQACMISGENGYGYTEGGEDYRTSDISTSLSSPAKGKMASIVKPGRTAVFLSKDTDKDLRLWIFVVCDLWWYFWWI